MREIRDRQFDLGSIFHDAAVRHPDLRISLDHSLECGAVPADGLTLKRTVQLVNAISSRLRDHGVVPGSVVMVWHKDGFDLPILASAISRLGAVPAMLSPHLSVDTVTELHPKIGASHVLAEARGAELLRDSLPNNTRILITDQSAHVTAHDAVESAQFENQRENLTAYRFDPHDPILITHTSGTTRLPKLAVHSGRSLWYRVFPQQMISLLLSPSAPGLMSVTLVHTRFFGALGMFFWRGKPLIVARDHDLDSITQVLLTHRPDYIETHPNTFVDWEPLATDPRKPLSGVKVLHAAFDAIHPRTMRVFLEASARGARFFRFYGQSEVGPSTGQWYTKKTVKSSVGQIVGRPVPGLLSVRIVDSRGRKVRRGTTGHIWIASRSRILGYKGDSEAFLTNVHGRWWDTGDMGSIDPLGRLRLADREIDHVAGVPSALHCEDILMEQIPSVREAIIAEKDSAPVVLVSLNSGLQVDEDELRFVVAEISSIKDIYVVDHELFPFTATRKVQRPKLGQRIADPELFERSIVSTIQV